MNNTQQEALAEFIQVTQADLSTARHMMEASDWDVNKAISLFFETGGASGGGSFSPPPSHAPTPFVEPEVRAPIPQRVQRLVDFNPAPPTQTGFNQHLPSAIQNLMGTQFQNEWKEFENQMKQHSFMQQPSSASSTFVRSQSNNSGFEKLFSPPKEIVFNGSFQAAKEYAEKNHKWLLIDIHSQKEFESMRLNRDTWSNETLQSIIQVYFVFWQVPETSKEGQRVMNLYGIHSLPFIGIVDSRTGEMKKSWNKFISASEMIAILQKWAETYSMEPSTPTTPQEQKKSVSFKEPTSIPVKSSSSSSIGMSDYMDFSEPHQIPPEFIEDDDEELRLAIAASLETPSAPSVPVVSQPKITIPIPAGAQAKVIAPAPAVPKPVVSQPTVAPAPVVTPAPAPAPVPVAKPADHGIDVQKYIVENTSTVESTRIQLRLPSGAKVYKLIVTAPLAVLYAIARQQLSEQDKTKEFSIIFVSTELPNTLSETLKDRSINNASLSLKFL